MKGHTYRFGLAVKKESWDANPLSLGHSLDLNTACIWGHSPKILRTGASDIGPACWTQGDNPSQLGAQQGSWKLRSQVVRQGQQELAHSDQEQASNLARLHILHIYIWM